MAKGQIVLHDDDIQIEIDCWWLYKVWINISPIKCAYQQGLFDYVWN